MNTWKLLLLRHGKSSWSEPQLSDFDRPLKKRGWRDAKRMGRFLIQEGILPEVIYASTAKRVEQTTARLLKGMDQDIQVVSRADLYHAPLHLIHDMLTEQPAQVRCMLMIGHNPGLEDFLTWLVPTVVKPQLGKFFPTATLAEITASVPFSLWRPGQVVLQRMIRPRHLVLDSD